MKEFIIAVAILLVFSSLSLGLSAYSDERLDEIIELADAISEDYAKSESSRQKIELAMSKWEKYEALFHITINRNEMITAKKEIAGALGASRAGDPDEFLAATERLSVTLDNIKGYTKLRIENVF